MNNLCKTLLILPIMLMACGETQEEVKETPKVINNEVSDYKDYAAGKSLMENKCYVCHNPKVKEEHLIAPPMIAVKEAYDFETESEFVEAIKAFVARPSEEKAKLKEAVEKYGLMPYQHYSPEAVEQIALYLFNNEIETPSWWEGGTKTSEQPTDFGDDYGAKGLHYAQTTKQVLGMNLMGTIQKEGTLAALTFCNHQAYPLTDSMALVHNASIRRVSDQPRNPKNNADEVARKHIEQYKNTISQGKDPKPIVAEKEAKATVYYPIVTNDKCLLCHGKKESIAPDVREKLAQLYPQDQATGYAANEVRGVWEIIFEK